MRLSLPVHRATLRSMRNATPWLLSLAICVGCGGGDGEEKGPTNDAGMSNNDAGVSLGDAQSAAEDAAQPAADAEGNPDPNALCTTCGACEQTLRIQSALHSSTPIDYEDLPPAGGNHAPCWTRYGVHTQEKADEIWVHNLEHGAVVFLYRCDDGCADERARLEAIAADHPFAIVMPYAALPTQFAVVSWGHRLLSPCFDEAAFLRFYEEHVDLAPESIRSDGSC